MLYENIKDISLPAGGDFTSAAYHLVTLGTDGQLALANNGDATPPVGIVAMNADQAAAGTMVPVALIASGGIMTGVAGGTITRGQILVADASGSGSDGRLVGVAGMTNIAANTMAVGIALEAASNGGRVLFLAQPVFKS